VELLGYFGETFAAAECESCDNCLEPRASYDGTTAAQKFLSCVYRIRQATGFGVGLNHVVEVLTGADTEKIRRWNHHTLSTYGIGRDIARPEWAAIGRELTRLGLLTTGAGEFPTLELSEHGLAALRNRQVIMLTKPLVTPKSRPTARRSGEIACDEVLFGRLRDLRKRLADERGVPAYVIFGDATLREMARRYPVTRDEMRGITGIGEKKLAEFAAPFAAVVAGHLETYPRIAFPE
jgi:ATP-dependent DNA helicase RecQ